MKLNVKNTALAALTLALASLSLFSCASSPKETLSQTGDPYYDNNIRDFSVSALDNGIPLIFKKTENEVVSFNLMISGGASLVDRSLAGLEDITLNLMLHGSADYPYQTLQQIFYEKNFSIASSCDKEFSIVSAACIKKDLAQVIPVFADGVLHPLFNEEDFDNIITDEKERLASSLSDPSRVLSLELAKAAFKGHPYASTPSALPDTIASISLDDVKAHHRSLLNAKRLSFVVVGNFSAKEQKKIEGSLNELFGSLPALSARDEDSGVSDSASASPADITPELAASSDETIVIREDSGSIPSESGLSPYEPAQIPPLEVRGPTVYATCATAEDTGYIAGYYAIPKRGSDEYIAYAIATMYLDDLFFSNVREKYGAVYSIGSGAIGASQLLGVHSIYKATEKQNLQKYVLEAIDAFPSEAEIEEKLQNYKNKFIAILFSASQNASGVARNIMASQCYNDSPSGYLERSRQVKAVTASQVAEAYAKWIAQSPSRAKEGRVNPIRWIVVSGDKSVREFKFN